MKVLVVGSGGREHALAWKIAQSPMAERVFVAPGNAGTARTAGCENLPIGAGDIPGLLDFARKNSMDLTVVGPEDPLCNGLVDRFADAGLLAFGPTAAAARLEGSKAFCKELFRSLGIPTAPFGVVESMEEAERYLARARGPQVVKADGLAAGKGVIVCGSRDDALSAAADMLEERRFGEAGARLVIEDRLEGEESSFMALCDGERVVPLASSQDHKRAFDGDEGPNTGGMGAYSPAPVLDEVLASKVMEMVMRPLARGMTAAGTPYRGVLYAGLMLRGDDVQVLEVNCRFGDPETQPVLARLSEDLLPLLLRATRGELEDRPLQTSPLAALCVVMAAGGYPGSYDKGQVVEGLGEAGSLDDVLVFHAGTTLDACGRVVTSGGRVLGVTALGDGIEAAKRKAYQAVDRISWPGARARRDIGHRAIARTRRA
ncbi:MAG: phosphoribosylamine--glycine ligase [Polyangia bacterium]|jgi:phosphoribosylamine--glycine ligase|nr:phosphoribosylamine--glycine ligase [Polyangia bacterium]